MRFRTLEIRWHDSKPIASCDFQPVPFKKARPNPPTAQGFASQAYRLATAGEDHHVRVWMVYPNIRTASDVDDSGVAPRPARVEYLATLSRHSAAVNVVRFSPNGDLIASAGDDGMVIIWAPSATPQTSTYGSDLSPADLQHEKEFWKPRTTFRCTTMQVYDLAWSPTGEFVLCGSTDNCARVFASADGKCMHEIAEHSHFVQGVAWDPLNEYIATQSSDRAMHVYKISASKGTGTFEAHAVGRNTRFPSHPHHGHGRDRAHSRTPSVQRDELLGMGMATPMNTPINPNMPGFPLGGSGTGTTTGANETWTGARPRPFRSASIESDRAKNQEGGGDPDAGDTDTVCRARDASEYEYRSSFSGSNAPSSPSFSAVSGFSRYGRSPSPMPALPAIRTPPNASAAWAERTRSRERGGSTSSRYDDRAGGSGGSQQERGRHGYDERRYTDGARLYGDESFTNFFRRLAFSPDGGLLLTPAGTFEDPSASVVGWDGKGGNDNKGEGGSGGEKMATSTTAGDDASAPARGRKARPVISTALAGTSLGVGSTSNSAPGAQAGTGEGNSNSNSSVYIYSRANFARPPVAQLPGHKKASVAVRFNPVQANMENRAWESAQRRGRKGDVERARDMEESMEVDLVGPLTLSPPVPAAAANTVASGSGVGNIVAPAPQRSFDVLASPALSPIDKTGNVRRPPTPMASKPGTPAPGSTTSASVTPSAGAGHSSSVTPATGSVFALPYRMLYAVVTMDTVAIYDTQQAGPVCLLTKLHYDEFTDLTWSPDGQCLMLSSRDGYCTLVTFDEILPTHHTQQAALQLQQIAVQHSVPISYAPSSSSSQSQNRSDDKSVIKKRPHEPLTPAASVDGDATATPAPTATPTPVLGGMTPSTSGMSVVSDATDTSEEAGADGPPKKKRRVALTRVGDL
ncbi:WD-REPEATS-REGION domain-containing protein [Mycena sanguinolenta]|uniref:WD-REPEATS-REGION domain-containing protein n=1 Tax=Mycena sanguinolenta TaxID=230812 RepID=A0A8H7D5A3_9AGAR|nr:WD-REPEATS-REGION domain-containing protein [Mycena sanguinolenta]